MPTPKKRVYITLNTPVDKVLEKIAKRDNVPIATKASQLLALALESEESEIWDTIASKRDTKDATFTSHDNAWL